MLETFDLDTKIRDIKAKLGDLYEEPLSWSRELSIKVLLIELCEFVWEMKK